MTPPPVALAHALPQVGTPPAPAAPRAPVRRLDPERVIADLHTRHGAELLRFCRWMLKDADDAADALQDAWIRALSALTEDRVRVVAYRPWLFSIARNVCLDMLRERKRASVHELDESSAGNGPGADEVVAIRHEADAALALVGSLSERQRAALLMRELAGMSIPDIAEALGVTAHRAQWAIDDARRALDEARAGSSLACDDARSRIGSGHRNRALKVHLDSCAACRTHDRKQRARRVLAPAFLPFLWIKRLAWPLASLPAAAATVAAVSLPLAGPAPAPAPTAPAPPRAAVLALPAPPAADPARPRVRDASAARPSRRRNVAPEPTPATAVEGSIPAVAAPPVSAPAATPAGPDAPERALVPAAAQPVVDTVRRTADRTAELAAGVPVAGPVAGRVVDAAVALLP